MAVLVEDAAEGVGGGAGAGGAQENAAPCC